MTDILSEIAYVGLHLFDDPALGRSLIGSLSVPDIDPAAGAHAAPGVARVTTLYGGTIAPVIGGLTPHTWVADANGVYHTSTNLAAEWKGYYNQMLAGHGDMLTPIQRLEGNAEAVFESTAINRVSMAKQAVFREDVQREIDVLAAAMTINQAVYGTDPGRPLTVKTYLDIAHTVQASPVLEELGLQGHGLNQPPVAKYNGYTNDFQNKVDGATFYVGGGLNQGKNAIAAFFDDNIMSHAPYAVVWHEGQLMQLNQNGKPENPLTDQAAALNEAMYARVYVTTDFSTNAAARGPTIYIPGAQTTAVALPTPNATTSLYGATLPTHVAAGLTPHAWNAGIDGVYHTSADLAAEWNYCYEQMLKGHGGDLTAVQRLEGNAQALFENTGISRRSVVQQAIFREAVQRDLDAIAAAMTINDRTLGIDDGAAFTQRTYLALEHTLQGNTVLQELALQGIGLKSATVAKYRGFTCDFQMTVDFNTYYVGGGLDSGQRAIANFFDDNILSHMAFPSAMNSGSWKQLNQNGNVEGTLAERMGVMNTMMYGRVLVAADFSTNAAASGPQLTIDTVAAYEASLPVAQRRVLRT